MATWRERFLASVDRMFGWDWGFGDPQSEHTRNFYTGWGVKMAIVNRDGHVRVLGSSRWVVHRYDGLDNLLSRIPMRKTLKKGERVVYGYSKAYEAYLNQPGYVPYAPGSGFTNY